MNDEIKFRKRRKRFLIIGIIIVVVVIGLIGNEMRKSEQAAKGQINPPKGYTYLVGENFNDVVTLFETAGFTNVTLEALGDLTGGFGDTGDDGDVKEVSINGDTDFNATDGFTPDAKVIIRYHTFSENEEGN